MFSWLKDYYTNLSWYLTVVIEINRLFDTYITCIQKKKKKITILLSSDPILV